MSFSVRGDENHIKELEAKAITGYKSAKSTARSWFKTILLCGLFMIALIPRFVEWYIHSAYPWIRDRFKKCRAYYNRYWF